MWGSLVSSPLKIVVLFLFHSIRLRNKERDLAFPNLLLKCTEQPRLRQVPWTQGDSPTWVTENQELSHHLLLSRMLICMKCIVKSEADPHLWHAYMGSGCPKLCSNCCAKCLYLSLFFDHVFAIGCEKMMYLEKNNVWCQRRHKATDLRTYTCTCNCIHNSMVNSSTFARAATIKYYIQQYKQQKHIVKLL